MINTKFIFANLFFAILILFGTQAQARGAIWTSTIYYSDATRITIVAPGYIECLKKRAAARDNPPQEFITYGSTKCVPVIYLKDSRELKELKIIPDLKFPFPWPPVCLSCPSEFKEKILKHIYPDDFKQVQQLMDRYNVDSYNKEVFELQKNYDFEGFEKELSEIEKNIENR